LILPQKQTKCRSEREPERKLMSNLSEAMRHSSAAGTNEHALFSNKQGRRLQRSRPMPLVQIHAIKGVFSPETKKKIIEKVTDAMVQVEGENLRRVTVVTINEIDSGDWGIGGKPLTTEAVKEMATGRHAA